VTEFKLVNEYLVTRQSVTQTLNKPPIIASIQF